MKTNRVIIFKCLILLQNPLTVIVDKYQKYRKIKIQELEWDKLSNCDITIDPQFDKDVPHKDLNISYNLDQKSLCLDKYQVTNSFLQYILKLYINEYHIKNNFDYIYYCSNC